ncbi:NAD(P)/FAD-dependent oxidoreductase [Pseudonocardia sp.]|uniref:NAD(P)/FAD-dependent oxidoreductase n=1 Tax=Pseudonocardia sp. TaxID=60912 RepID=UPI003D118018
MELGGKSPDVVSRRELPRPHVLAEEASLVPLQLDTTVVAGSVEWGGALMTTTEVENYPGFKAGIQGPELMSEMLEQAQRFGATVVPDDAVDLRLAGPVKTVVDATGRSYRSAAVILAMGSAYRRLGLPGEQRLSGSGVSWCATCDGAYFQDKVVAVVGGGDSAMEEALFLTRFASRVLVLHRRSALRASVVMQERAFAHGSIEFVWNVQVTDVLGTDRVTGVRTLDTGTGAERTLAVDALFVAIGHEPRSQLVRDHLACDLDGYVLVEGRSTRTTVPGVFAAGDLVDRTYRQAITAAGSGCQAAMDAERYLTDAAERR